MKEINFIVYGDPVGKARPRVSFSTKKVNGVEKKSVHAYNTKKTYAYESLVKDTYKELFGDFMFDDDAMIKVDIMAYFAIPKSATKKRKHSMMLNTIRPTKKPDYDNIGKIICDSLNGIAYKDDSQIVDANISKFYAVNPYVSVTLTQIGD